MLVKDYIGYLIPGVYIFVALHGLAYLVGKLVGIAIRVAKETTRKGEEA